MFGSTISKSVTELTQLKCLVQHVLELFSPWEETFQSTYIKHTQLLYTQLFTFQSFPAAFSLARSLVNP